MYSLQNNQNMRIEQYQTSSPFASFLPGLAGPKGIPMWAFYVNRGQGLASFGVKDKSSVMTEFFPADKSYQMVPYQGFRSFLKVKKENDVFSYEPFFESNEKHEEAMTIAPNRLTLEHKHQASQVAIEVDYLTLPNESIPGLIREVTIRNENDQPVQLEMADGLATMFPAGVENSAYQAIGNTMKSWFDATTVDDQFNFYFMRGSTADEANVSEVHNGNVYASLLKTSDGETVLKPIYDRELIFGDELALHSPRAFNQHQASSLLEKEQVSTNKVSCAFSVIDQTIEANGEIKLYSVFVQVDHLDQAKQFVNEKMNQAQFDAYKTQAETITAELMNQVETKTANPLFDAYVSQNYLDNGLRGGFSYIFENEANKKVFYLYSRKHGDLERDYNDFSISPSFYSQGNGNYRDMNQNRRLDVLFEPRIEDYNIKQFINLIQLDGHNPLAIKAVIYQLNNEAFPFESYGFTKDEATLFKQQIAEGYTPGSALKFIKDKNVKLNVDFEAFLTDLLAVSEEVLEASHGEGFWIDHWTYNLDLIDSYLSVFPDRLQSLFFSEDYTYYDSPASIRPQQAKISKQDEKVRQYDAVEEDEEKTHENGQWVRKQYGQGDVVKTNLLSKLFLLSANKVSTIAPFGLGVEMEAGKPGWNDALNGLPGMFGAGVSELYELKRLLQYFEKVNQNDQGTVKLPIETEHFISQLTDTLANLPRVMKEDQLTLWKQLTSIRDDYRQRIASGVEGKYVTFNMEDVHKMVAVFNDYVDFAVNAVEQFDQNLVPTYFYFTMSLADDGEEILDMIPHAVSPFLEGIVKKMKLADSYEEAKELYEKVKVSPIYDQKLGMYKTSGPISNDPVELGRAKFFTPGWLENESVFLHMTYKYLLELLKSGLYDEFFQDCETGLVAYLDPKMYGRSILENSSFIASSANPDPSTHGKGYVARLSGSTIEFLNMWMEMFIGKEPFKYDEARNELIFALKPVLPKDFFTESNQAQFKLFKQIDVIYHNKQNKDTYGDDGVQPVHYTLTLSNGQHVQAEGPEVTGSLAEQIRSMDVRQIDVELG
ncbi:hypothetical protein SAMN05421734_105195 [Pelagirhabdus alkalitolerans]|uniref:Cellobiose phosphorylase n=1 Tax=Pelagirhabdus alkalitolerans TaxID=1612202 RepID=A0A1G6JZ99_9BACI|nr:hypothetical protein [Pelagirhabdus alkalitolerans]SDC24037.1 hypothetical protein SAMN05421734_105195 [Pelagirhabdus alkalitolerans]